MTGSFFFPASHGFFRVSIAVPRVVVADPEANAANILSLAREADANGAGLVLFPELSLSAYAIDDLLHQSALLSAVERALETLLRETRELPILIVVGAPLRHRGRLYNCAVFVLRGEVVAVIPKTYLPNYREFYERRHFASGAGVENETIRIGARQAPFGVDLLLEVEDVPGLVVHAEICEDLWTPIPPSAHAALAGATILLNLSASNATVGKSDYRKTLCAGHSGRCVAAYLYSAAGQGESTTDLAWDGEASIFEAGALIASAPRFSSQEQLILCDIDLGKLLADRQRQNTFHDCSVAEKSKGFRKVAVQLNVQNEHLDLLRPNSRFPFVPADESRLAELCFEAVNIQASGLAQRLRASRIDKLVVGVSGGLDSTLALLVAASALEMLGLPRTHIHGYSLPGFATSERTRANALRLMRALDVTAAEIDIIPACRQMLADIGHPAAAGEPVYDVTFENVQAGARTSLLFRLANRHNALVLGTGDLSELALGWCTYGVGDQMSHYNVNASVPKTLIQHLIRWCAREARFGQDTVEALSDILATEISPELVPGETLQKTQDVVGPYALQDFTLYYTTRYGFAPSKIAFLAYHAWREATADGWPSGVPTSERVSYSLAEIRHWLSVFLRRFFETSQFKRSAAPNGPKVSSGGSLSPRGDWRAPSDSSAAAFLADLEKVPTHD